jgi:hypothetical protein
MYQETHDQRKSSVHNKIIMPKSYIKKVGMPFSVLPFEKKDPLTKRK